MKSALADNETSKGLMKAATALDWIPLRFLTGLPIILLVLMALSWMIHGVDVPMWDDWRDFAKKQAGSFDLKVLFEPANDTLYPVGRFLDALSFRFLGGNAIAYQFLSMTLILGLLLFFQWRLLRKCLDDRFAVAASFFLTCLMMQGGSYWGLQALAYHQAVPAVCLLAILDIAIAGPQSKRVAALYAFLIGLVAGLTYISGAFAMFVAAVILLLIASRFEANDRGNLGVVGWSMLASALMTLPAQLWVIIVHQKGTHRPDAPMAYPTESDFWMYLLGKIGRSLGLPPTMPALSLTIVVLLVASSILLACWYGRAFLQTKLQRLPQHNIGIVLIVLGSAIFAYLLLVAAGRTNLRDPALVEPLAVFAFGYPRFHYFWVTLLWPAVAAAAFVYVRSQWPNLILARLSIAAIAAALVVNALAAGKMNYSNQFERAANQRAKLLSCVINGYKDDTDLAECRTLDIGVSRQAVAFAVEKNASFARGFRYLTVSPAIPAVPDFRLSGADSTHISVRNSTITRLADGAVELTPGSDPMLLINMPAAKNLRTCAAMTVVAVVEAAGDDTAQIFYLPGKEVSYRRENVATVSFSANSKKAIRFDVISSAGFNQKLRFDPVTKKQAATVRELEVFCRRRI